MIPLFRVYFDSVDDATEIYALTEDDAAEYVAGMTGRKVEDAVVRYVKSVTAEAVKNDLKRGRRFRGLL